MTHIVLLLHKISCQYFFVDRCIKFDVACWNVRHDYLEYIHELDELFNDIDRLSLHTSSLFRSINRRICSSQSSAVL
jgi:hypothetical protein